MLCRCVCNIQASYNADVVVLYQLLDSVCSSFFMSTFYSLSYNYWWELTRRVLNILLLEVIILVSVL